MARLYRHKVHGWQIHYWIHFGDGTRKRKFRYYRNKLEAQRYLSDIEALEYRTLHRTASREDVLYWLNLGLISQDEADRIIGASAVVPNLGELASEWLEKSQLECRPKTHKMNVYRIGHLLRFFGTDTPVTKIDLEWIEQYRKSRLQDVSPATVNKEMIKLAQLLDLAVKRRAIPTNPAREIPRLRDERERKPRALTSEEIQKLLDVARQEDRLLGGLAYEIFLTYLYTGMRRTELLYLEWEDIDFDRRQIRIQAKWEKGGFVTKTGKARVVGLARPLAEILSQLPRKGRYVFGGQRPLVDPRSVTRAFKILARRAGLPETVTLHSLRHTYITHLMEKGVNPRRVQELAGHKTFRTTWRYAHVLPRDRVEEDLLDFGLSRSLVGEKSDTQKVG
ncbi:MAG: hypothetical protein DRG40_02775 [Deltaproteobacteria bacterium]|nr:MAG: hypothetical protein DRG40_02775 [Deltaproteobacteria bacterium]